MVILTIPMRVFQKAKKYYADVIMIDENGEMIVMIANNGDNDNTIIIFTFVDMLS